MSKTLDAAGLSSNTTLEVMAVKMTQVHAATGDKSRAQLEGIAYLGQIMMHALAERSGGRNV